MSITKDVSGAISRGFIGYFNFKGVASRRDFWIWLGLVVVVNNVVDALYWVLILPTIAYGARRMHDVGKSAWWLLVWPVALFFALRPSVSGFVSASHTPMGTDWISDRVSDAQSLVKTAISRFEAVRKVLTGSSSESATTPSSSVATSPPAKPESPSLKTPASKSTEKSKPSVASREDKPTTPSEIEVFTRTIAGLGIAAASDESVVALVQSLLRHTWTEVRAQQETDPSHTDHVRLAVRALAGYATGRHSLATRDPLEQAKAWLWYGILLALVSTDDRGPTTLGSEARLSSSEAFRESRRLFESKGDKKMAGRSMEELGQLGRLLGRSDMVTEGFDQAVELFQSAGASDRAKQALTNAGSNFQRHSSAFFDGGQHSLKATTILGSIQGERLRAALHHLD